MTVALRSRQRRVVAGDQADFGSGVHRYRDRRFDAIAVKVFPGEHYVTEDGNEMLVTVLGSCVGVTF